MLHALTLTTILTLAAPPDGGAKAEAVAPVVGEGVAVVVHVDLDRLDVQGSLRRMLGKAAIDEDVEGPSKAVGGRVDALKKAGAKDLFVLFDLADMPGLPVALVPRTAGADAEAIARVLSGLAGNAPGPKPEAATIRGAVVAGTPAALARIRAAKAADRPELAEALGAGGDALIRVAVVPGAALRRSVEEALPTLPAEFGGGPVTVLTRGMRWASLALTVEPRPTVRAVVQATDPGAAKSLRKLVQDALNVVAGASRKDPAVASLAEAIGRIRPEAEGDRVTFEADPANTAALVAVPLGRAREAARRSQCVNNLKQVGLAMHNYHGTHGAFPAAFNAGKDGTPLLSWRVHILPFLEQKALYDQFHLDEPWDSAHNKALVSKMPNVYACPSARKSLAAEGKTSYLTPRGPGTIFPGSRSIKLQEVSDGTSNTILVVEANDEAAVTWTRPDDWDASAARNLFGHHPGGTNVGFADGSVRFLKESIKRKVLHDLTTRGGGEVFHQDDL